jgi:tellurite resistance protein TehA-like permease
LLAGFLLPAVLSALTGLLLLLARLLRAAALLLARLALAALVLLVGILLVRIIAHNGSYFDSNDDRMLLPAS